MRLTQNPIPKRYTQLALLVAILLVSSVCVMNASATWTRVAVLNQPVKSGFFFDANHGIVGTATDHYPGSQCSIFRTTDGGASWMPCSIPNTNGDIGTIFMENRAVGYAAITFSSAQIWKTIDSGKTWSVLPNLTFSGDGSGVFKTRNALINTSWDGTSAVRPANTSDWNPVFGKGSSLGIAFRDDTDGIVTPGYPGGPCFVTHDGGLTWSPGATLTECYGIYADPTSGYFYTLPEGTIFVPSYSVFRSTDDGASWQALSTTGINNAYKFTGKIAGWGQRLYVQRQDGGGLLRSDDGGYDWFPIGGPSNIYDTHICVTGCYGATVYAFDEYGGIWKTRDGGDGTISDSVTLEAGLSDSTFTSEPGQAVAVAVILKAGSRLGVGDKIKMRWLTNTDILSPTDFRSKIPNAELDSLWTDHDTVSAIISVDSEFLLTTDTVLGYLNFQTYISDTLQTTLQSLDIVPVKEETCPLATSVTPNELSVQITTCGAQFYPMAMRLAQPLTITALRPNPTNGMLHVSVTAKTTDPILYQIFDAQGRVVQSGPLSPDEALSVHNLPSGSYTFRATVNGATASENFIRLQ